MLGRLFWRRKAKPLPPSTPWGLDTPLFQWSAKNDVFTIRNACEHVICMGASGSGKTSGSCRFIARNYMLAGFGGLILLAKDDRQYWEQLARETGRADDLMVWGPENDLTFNFLDWEYRRPSRGAGYTENIIQVFEMAIESANRGSGGGDGREDASYWRNAMRQLLRGTLDLLGMADKPLTVRNISQVIISAPKSRAELLSPQWSDTSFCFQCLADAQRRATTPDMQEDFESIKDYWCADFAAWSDKTRGSVVSTYTSVADVLTRGPLRRLLCAGTTITPDLLEKGKILLLDMPLPQFGVLGQIAQQIMKYSFFQKSMERRDVATSPRPVFLISDEAQFFVSSYDMLFMSTCRSSRVANLYLTQNVNNFYAALGGSPKAQAEANSIFGNCGTKIMHANADHTTTEWQANLIGRRIKAMMNGSNGRGGSDWAMAALGLGHAGETSAGYSEQLQYEIEPAEFSRLKTGGPANGGIVQGIVFQNGKRFLASGRSWLLVDFQQER